MSTEELVVSLNPLESGQSFEYRDTVKTPGIYDMSQSPRIGAIIRIYDIYINNDDYNLVSIPSNRGNHSNLQLKYGQRIQRIQSQSPRIGAIIRIIITDALKPKRIACLNPLESGQSFE